jgi:hypothetical protein
VAPHYVDGINWPKATVSVALTRAGVVASPAYRRLNQA